jgi:hypothetical protein
MGPASSDANQGRFVRRQTAGSQAPVLWPVIDPPSGSVLYDVADITAVVQVVRPDDLLSLTFGLINLTIQAGQLVRADPAKPATIIVGLPPQHIADAILPDGAPADVTPAVASALAGGSQLAFTVPAAITALPLNLQTLLAWASLTPVSPSQPAGTPRRPSGSESVLELPYRMLLAVDGAQWQHSTAAVVDPATGVAELWRTRADAPSLHVAWSQDLDPPFRIPPPRPPKDTSATSPGIAWPPSTPDVAGSLHAGDRSSIAGQAPALTVDSLTMSALGATTSLHVSLPNPDGSHGIQPGVGTPTVTGWQHIISLGRDSYVKVTSQGYLAPFGHPAALVTVTERLPSTAPPGSLERLVQTTRLIITSPLVDYTDPDATAAYSAQGAAMSVPLSKVHLPDQALPPISLGSGGVVQTAAGTPLQFGAVAEDLNGAAVELSLPMAYVDAAAIPAPDQLDTLYTDVAPASLSGQSVAFVGAPGPVTAAVGQLDGSVLPVDTMSFILSPGSGSHPFLPQLDVATVRVPSVSALAGDVAGTLPIKYHPAYLLHGVEPSMNPGAVFASVQSPPMLAMAANAAGGLAAPQFNVDGLSQNIGPVAGVDKLLNGNFDPTSLLSDATFLGGIKLSELIAPIKAELTAYLQLPGFAYKLLPNATSPKTLQTTYSWSPALQQSKTLTPTPPAGAKSSGIFTIDTTQSSLSLSATVTTTLDGSSPPTSEVKGRLTDITFSFLDAVELEVDLLAFDAVSGRKVSLSTGPHLNVGFSGDLAFVDELAQALPADGLADGPHVEADASGVTAGYSVAIPSIGVGIVSIQNVAFAASLSLPFAKPLGLRLEFSTQEHPFLVSVSFIAGGGFFCVDVGSDGVHEIQGSLELGADLSVDLAIVKAEVHAMAGFYFGLTNSGQTSGPTTTFSGFLRVGGSVDLLGLISVSIELYLQLAYTSNKSQIAGSASLTLSVHLLFVTKSVTLHMEKHFDVPGTHALTAGLAALGPVSFGDLISPDAWNVYLGAFA